jgi:arabinogalactan oligomer / maltooligosaccharide transport system permease protein
MRTRTWVIWAFLTPVLVVMTLIVFIPLVEALYTTFTNMNRSNQGTIFRPPSYEFIGLDNYVRILSGQDRFFYPTLIWTTVWTIVNVFFHYTLGLILALVLNQRFRGRTAYRLLLLLPWAVPAYISAIAWLFIFNGEYGLLNNILTGVGGTRVAWLSEFPWYYVAPIIVNVWLGVPFMMVALLGGLQTIPSDQYEAARVDGAGAWQSFWHITLPGLRTVSQTVILLGSIWTFNLFAVIYFVTGGGPAGKTEILVTFTYRAFERGDLAIAATYAAVVFSLLLVFSLFYRRLTREAT